MGHTAIGAMSCDGLWGRSGCRWHLRQMRNAGRGEGAIGLHKLRMVRAALSPESATAGTFYGATDLSAADCPAAAPAGYTQGGW